VLSSIRIGPRCVNPVQRQAIRGGAWGSGVGPVHMSTMARREELC
jgi:hypothetical protein